MADVKSEITAYKKVQKDLEAKHRGKWVLFHNGKLVALYDSFNQAAEDAGIRFGSGPYLIRQIGAPPLVMYSVGYA